MSAQQVPLCLDEITAVRMCPCEGLGPLIDRLIECGTAFVPHVLTAIRARTYYSPLEHAIVAHAIRTRNTELLCWYSYKIDHLQTELVRFLVEIEDWKRLGEVMRPCLMSSALGWLAYLLQHLPEIFIVYPIGCYLEVPGIAPLIVRHYRLDDRRQVILSLFHAGSEAERMHLIEYATADLASLDDWVLETPYIGRPFSKSVILGLREAGLERLVSRDPWKRSLIPHIAPFSPYLLRDFAPGDVRTYVATQSPEYQEEAQRVFRVFNLIETPSREF